MIITRAYEVRIYPTKKQVNMINKNIGCARVVYNTALNLRKTFWERYICNKHHDRDINAAINIKNEGLRILDNQGTVRNTETGVIQDTPMPVENPTIDERSVMNLKSSDSVNQELLYKDFIPNGEGPAL